MRKSSRVFLVYAMVAVSATVVTCFLEYQTWLYEPLPSTLGAFLHPLALVAIPMAGISLFVQILSDRLAWRVVRRLRIQESRGVASR